METKEQEYAMLNDEMDSLTRTWAGFRPSKDDNEKRQAHILKTVHLMGIRSLSPESFTAFEGALNDIIDARGLPLFLDAEIHNDQ